MIALDEFLSGVAADPGGVLLIGSEETARRAAALKIHTARGRTDALVTVDSKNTKQPRTTGIPPGATVYLEDAATLSFAEQEDLLESSRSAQPWKVVAGAEARDELHDAVAEERMRPAVYHLVSSHFYDFDKGLAAMAKAPR